MAASCARKSNNRQLAVNKSATDGYGRPEAFGRRPGFERPGLKLLIKGGRCIQRLQFRRR